jgi:hypothetical protein
MTVLIQKALRDKLMNIHELIVQGTQPFVKRGDKTYMRFDKIVLQGIQVAYFWQEAHLYTYYNMEIEPVPEQITLVGFTAETEVFIV